MPTPRIDIKSFEDMFKLNEEYERGIRDEARMKSGECDPIQFPIDKLHPFAYHPFKRYDEAKMAEMVQSVKEHGILSPILVRRHEETGDWEIISGHNRVEAARLAGLEFVPGFPRNVDDNTAAIMMVDSNFNQRDKILPSERAFAYKLKLEAIKRQGARTDLTSPQFAAKSRSDDTVAQESGDSGDTVRRYIRLTELIQPLLDKVDTNKLGFIPAVSLSYLTRPQQEMLNEYLDVEGKTVPVIKAEALKQRALTGTLDEEIMIHILSDKIRPMIKDVKISYDSIQRFFPKASTPKEIESTIIRALKFLCEHEAMQAQADKFAEEDKLEESEDIEL